MTVGGVAELRDLSRAAVSPARDGIGSGSAAGRADLGAIGQCAIPGCVRPHSQPSREVPRYDAYADAGRLPNATQSWQRDTCRSDAANQ